MIIRMIMKWMKWKLIETLKEIMRLLLGMAQIAICTIVIHLMGHADWETALHVALVGCLANLIGRGIMERMKCGGV